MTRNVLVTGGAGFIGSHMAQRLLEVGFNVIILDNESTGKRENIPEGTIYIKGDVTNTNDITRVFEHHFDVVFHIAGQASTILSFDNPLADLLTNTVGTVNILSACLENKVPRILYASSMTVYGHPQKIPVSESEPVQPISYYGITKYAAEQYLISSARRNDLDFELGVTAFRMFNVYGARQRLDNPYQGVMGIFIGNLLRNETITIYGDGKQSRDFVHIDDVVDAWMAALDNKAANGKIFNVGVGKAISINKLIDRVLQTFGHSRQDWPIRFGPERPGDQRHMVADVTQAIEVLGWYPEIDLETGLKRTIAWAKTQM